MTLSKTVSAFEKSLCISSATRPWYMAKGIIKALVENLLMEQGSFFSDLEESKLL